MNNNIPIIYEDENIVVISKPIGMVVHEGAGDIGETVADWLVKKYSEMKKFFADDSRPGIIHRLDKNTSGILVCAKNPMTRAKIQAQFKARDVIKKYQTLVLGFLPKETGRIENYMSRDPKNRQLMRVQEMVFGSLEEINAKKAITEYKALKHYLYKLGKNQYILTLLEVNLKTGRMHQIRAQMKNIGHPVIGDPDYFTKPSRKISKDLMLERQFLHSTHIEFLNPENNEKLSLDSPLPLELTEIINKLKETNPDQ